MKRDGMSRFDEWIAAGGTWGPDAALPGIFALLAGLALGLVFFLLLRRAVALQLAGRGGAALALHVTRWAGAAIGFWLVAQVGAIVLLACLAGFTAARFLVRRRAGPPAAATALAGPRPGGMGRGADGDR